MLNKVSKFFLIFLLCILLYHNFSFRMEQKDKFYSLSVDSCTFIYWVQSIVHARNLGLKFLNSIQALIKHPETKLYQLFSIVYSDSFRIFNLASVSVLSLWLSIFKTSVLSAQIFSNILAIIFSILLGFTAYKLNSDKKDFLILIVTICLTAYNPYFLIFSVSPSWHFFALMFIQIAYLALGFNYEIDKLRLIRKIIAWLSLLFSLYSTYLVPAVFVFSYTIVSILISLRNKSFKKVIFFWASLLFFYFLAIAYIIFFDKTTVNHYAKMWLDFNFHRTSIALKNLFFSTSGLLFFIFFMNKKIFKKSLPFILYFLINALLFIFAMNKPSGGRIFVFFIPLIPICIASIWRHKTLRLVVIILALLFILGNSLVPKFMFKLFFKDNPHIIKIPIDTYSHQKASIVLKNIYSENAIYFFISRDEAVQFLCRIDNPNLKYISNIKKYLKALEENRIKEYLNLYYPNLKEEKMDRKIFVARDDADFKEIILRLKKYFSLETRKVFSFYNPFNDSFEKYFIIELSLLNL